jgi:2-dehydro-3-deoxygluconokinase
MTATELVTIGETMVLLSAPQIGALRHATNLSISIGGSESNVAIGAARLGTRTTWIGRVGSDEFGARVVREIRAEGVQVHAERSGSAPTGVMVKEHRTADTIRIRYYRTASAGSELSCADVDPTVIVEANVLHVTGITCGLSSSARAAVFDSVSRAKVAGVCVSLDLNYRSALWTEADFAATMRPLVAAADIVFASPQEASFLTGRTGPAADQARSLRALGPAQVIVKMGAEGAVAVTGEGVYQHAAHPVAVVDSVGAGDAFVAGWLAEHLAGRPITERMRTAIACGAFACTVSGDWEGSPTRDDLRRLWSPGPDGVSR